MILTSLGDNPRLRVDVRVTPYLRSHLAVWRWVGLFAEYGFTANISTADSNALPDYGYLRHLAQFGVEGRL